MEERLRKPPNLYITNFGILPEFTFKGFGHYWPGLELQKEVSADDEDYEMVLQQFKNQKEVQQKKEYDTRINGEFEKLSGQRRKGYFDKKHVITGNGKVHVSKMSKE